MCEGGAQDATLRSAGAPAGWQPDGGSRPTESSLTEVENAAGEASSAPAWWLGSSGRGAGDVEALGGTALPPQRQGMSNGEYGELLDQQIAGGDHTLVRSGDVLSCEPPGCNQGGGSSCDMMSDAEVGGTGSMFMEGEMSGACMYSVVDGGFAFSGDSQPIEFSDGFGDQQAIGSNFVWLPDWGAWCEVGDNSFEGSSGWFSGSPSEAGWDGDDTSLMNWNFDQGSDVGSNVPQRGDWPRQGRSPARGAGLRHVQVPRRLNLQAWSAAGGGGAGHQVTTLMVRNVPNRYDRSLLMQELDELGFQGKYDFVYLPIDNSTNWNVGYAFVNFEDPPDAKRCMAALDGHQFYRFRQNNRRVAQVSIAHIQGLELNLAHCSSTSLFSARPWLRPWVRKWSNRLRDTAQKAEASRPGSSSRLGIRRRSLAGELGDDEDSDDDCSLENLTLTPRLLNTPTVELTIGGTATPPVSIESLQELLSCGARRLKLTPDLTDVCIQGNSPWSAAAVRSTLRAVSSLHGVDALEIEILPAGSRRPLVLRANQLQDQGDVEAQTELVVNGLGKDDDIVTSGRGSCDLNSRSPAPLLDRGWSGGSWYEGRGWRRGHWRGSRPNRMRNDEIWKGQEEAEALQEPGEGSVPKGSQEQWGQRVWGQDGPGCAQSDSYSASGYGDWQPQQAGEEYNVAPTGDGTAGWSLQMGWSSENMMIFSEGDLRMCYMCPEQNGLLESQGAEDRSCVDAQGGATQPCQVGPMQAEGGDGAAASGEHMDADAARMPQDTLTTLMIHNVPCHYSDANLLQELERLGLHNVCNFTHLPQLPSHDGTTWNIGKAFVNFVTPAEAEHARALLQGHPWQNPAPGCEQVAEVSDAVIQGYETNMQHYAMRAVGDMSWSDSWCVMPPPSASGQSTCEPSLMSSPTVSPLAIGSEDVTPSQCSYDSQVPDPVSRTPSPSPDPRHHSGAAAMSWSPAVLTMAGARVRSRSPAVTWRGSDFSESSLQAQHSELHGSQHTGSQDVQGNREIREVQNMEATEVPKPAALPAHADKTWDKVHGPPPRPPPRSDAKGHQRRSGGDRAPRNKGGGHQAAERGRGAVRSKRAEPPEGPVLGIADWPALGGLGGTAAPTRGKGGKSAEY